ncbi:MAG: hypothetical protein ACRDFX_10250, partial [Chloroflexota bacterium]
DDLPRPGVVELEGHLPTPNSCTETAKRGHTSTYKGRVPVPARGGAVVDFLIPGTCLSPGDGVIRLNVPGRPHARRHLRPGRAQGPAPTALGWIARHDGLGWRSAAALWVDPRRDGRAGGWWRSGSPQSLTNSAMPA